MKKHIKSQKKKLRIYNPKLKEECGVFGISNIKDGSKVKTEIIANNIANPVKIPK